jgi:hypothetical protein
MRHSRSLQDAVANGGTTSLPAREQQIADNRTPIAMPGRPGIRRSVVPQNATGLGQVVLPYCPSRDIPYDRRMGGVIRPSFPRAQRDAEAGGMTDEVFVRTTLVKREHQMLLAEQHDLQKQREDVQKAENRAAIKMAENRATAAEVVSAIERHEEIKAAASKAAHDAKLRQIRSQRAGATLVPPVGANKPPIVGTTLLYDAGLSLHPEKSTGSKLSGESGE